MIHYQRPVDDHLEAIDALPAGAWVKSVGDQHLLKDIKARRGDIFTVFRYEDSVNQTPSDDYEENKAIARTFFYKFIDGTFWEQEMWRYWDAVEEWNEYLANSQHESEVVRWLLWCTAVCDVWYNEFCVTHVELQTIRLVLCNTAIGNDIDHRFAGIANDYKDRSNPPIMGYHSYVLVNDGETHPDNDTWLSNRWAALMDPLYVDLGYEVDWLFTESGAYRDVLGGWRHPQVYNGSLSAYIDGAITYKLDCMAEFNAANNGRALGFVLFTTGNIDPWRDYELGTPELVEIAEYASAYVPVTPPPPPPPPPPPVDECRGVPRVQYRRVYNVIPQDATLERAIEIFTANWTRLNDNGDWSKQTSGGSVDDAMIGDLNSRTARLYDIRAIDRQAYVDFRDIYYPGVALEFIGDPAAIFIDITNDLPIHETKRYLSRSLAGVAFIAIHHTVSPPSRTIDSIAAYHVDHNDWPGIGYHYVIKDTGEIYQTNELETKSYHVGNYNDPMDENAVSVGIALQGDFTNDPPPQAQLDAARELVEWLRNVLPLADVIEVRGHRNMPGAQTQCPGNTYGAWMPYVTGV